MPTTTAGRQPRLKDTCDRCSMAKVRCSRDKNCTRCASKGLPCVYSLSRRAGRRHGSKQTSSPRKERSSSSSPPPTDTDSAPVSPVNEMDAFYSWEFPTQSIGDLNSTLSSHLSLDGELYEMNDTLLQQPSSYLPALADSYSSLTSPHTIDAPELPMTFNTEPMSIEPLQAPIMHRSPTSSSILSVDSSSSINSSHVDSVHDELTNLTEFAERMEQKFDAVVRQRLQYRNMCSEFGVPDDLETPILEEFADFDSTSSGKKGPDLAEMSFYYSLSELRRRLKWLREDVGNILVHPGTGEMQC